MKDNSKVFCIECGCRVAYKVTSAKVDITVRGVNFSYIELSAICMECGEELYIPEINDTNVSAREDAYRKATNLITVSEIYDILNKYNIGRGPLAKLLGFGEVTINRYISGQLPSKSHSDKLYEIKHNRKLMEKYLEQGKDSITLVAYSKCREALDELNNLYGCKKIDLVARYLINKSWDITPLALQKLLYYSQAFYYAIFKEPLFEDDCQAWVLGPVYPEVYERYKEYGYNPIDKRLDDSDNELIGLTIKEINFLDIILSTFGQYSGGVLSKMTHSEKPWLTARGDLLPDDKCMIVIDRNAINEYFKVVLDKHSIVNPCDIFKYTDYMRNYII